MGDGVQTEGCFPLLQAMEKLQESQANYSENAVQQAMKQAAQKRSDFMNPWPEEPHSIAHGILDTETYDWVNFCAGMYACHTGCSGLAGMRKLKRDGAAGGEGVDV